ncbi:uncharacterized protein LOC9657817 isoform X1 [Selaginella moellendorffii]|uniref:uncharacterized protein LOC9657817 isoform X1 n=1 Tax=Selaginella moellendorffii TaxID=88036 RepID=UPI000D1C6FC3|nr:uncharacterized protein LOC9657817 isoform X1 [Selaginella moellendorffii]|eukprot:XP_024538912.1 uncharacterized protein LOC9657817 isoform X1 [Selaginella moellendorffii]
MAVLSRGKSLVENIMADSTMRSLFGAIGSKAPSPQAQQVKLEHSPSGTRKWIKELSPLANVVVGRCARILLLEIDDLKRSFEEEAPLPAKTPGRYARNFLEYCSFRALSVATQTSDHLSDKEFRRLSFDMMLAWEAPGAANKPTVKKDKEQGIMAGDKDEEDSALFYSDLMPMMVDVESTVGPDAFCRLAPAMPVVADMITVHCQFDALTATTGGRLPFPVYDKYIGELDKTIKSMKNLATPSLVSNLRLSKGEMIIDVDGTVTTQPVLQHINMSTWPGRLTLTDRALYFEAAGVVSYDAPKKYDLSVDLHHTVKPDLTGPWGARLFDKAITYKSENLSDPVVIEFPELTGHSRRDYWLAIVREVIMAHQFIRSSSLEGVGRSEARARAVLGCGRLRATKEAYHMLPRNPEALLTFSLTEELPGGDMVLEALAERLKRAAEGENEISRESRGSRIFSSAAVTELSALGTDAYKDAGIPVGEVLIGDYTQLEKAVQQARSSSRKVELAQSTIEGVRVEGIGTNVAIMKELSIPAVNFVNWLQDVASWREPFKAAMFCLLFSYIFYRDWVRYLPPLLLLVIVLYILWLRYSSKGKRDHEIVVPIPPGQSTLEQLMALQQAISQLEGVIQAANIFLLKIRALLLSAQPEATDQVLAILGGLALVLAALPLRWIALAVFLDIFTRQMHVRRESSERFNRRMKEWWNSIPVVPVRVADEHDHQS